MFFFSDVLYESICCGYSFELRGLVDAIQIDTHNICLYKEVDKKYTGCNLKTTELFDCALIGVCVVIRLNTVSPKITVYPGCHINSKGEWIHLLDFVNVFAFHHQAPFERGSTRVSVLLKLLVL